MRLSDVRGMGDVMLQVWDITSDLVWEHETGSVLDRIADTFSYESQPSFLRGGAGWAIISAPYLIKDQIHEDIFDEAHI